MSISRLCVKQVPRSGFSLLEVMIVLVVLAIAAALTIPAAGDTDDIRVRAAVRLLMADLGFAQVESIARPDDPCVVVFDIPTNTYHIARKSDSATPITNPADSRPYTVQFGSGRAGELSRVSIQSYSLDGDAILGFGQYGELDQITQATITVQAGSTTLTVQVDPITGDTTTTGS